jgi:Translation initiation factor 1A / IF-1
LLRAACKTLSEGMKKMSKEELIQFEGRVIEILPDARYRVHLDAGYEVVAYTAGKMKPDQDSGWRSCDHRIVALRSSEGPPYLPS